MAHVHTNADGTKSIVDEWGADDIQSVADCDFDAELTPEQVEQVMDVVVAGYDANIGINWEVISIAIEKVINQPTKE